MPEPVFERPDERAGLSNPVGGYVDIKLRGDRSGGSLTAFETLVAPGQGPPLHTHAAEDETLFVLEGRVRFKLGDEMHTGDVGSFVFVPRGIPHTFQNVGDDRARMLIHFTPSGMERFFDAFARLDAPSPEDFARLGAEAGMVVVGPPLARSHPAA
jgi:quercetin dioxygenase-like cupin family protein